MDDFILYESNIRMLMVSPKTPYSGNANMPVNFTNQMRVLGLTQNQLWKVANLMQLFVLPDGRLLRHSSIQTDLAALQKCRCPHHSSAPFK